jgi:hypothetical protein
MRWDYLKIIYSNLMNLRKSNELDGCYLVGEDDEASERRSERNLRVLRLVQGTSTTLQDSTMALLSF